jgi:hypothetical protein
MLYVYGWQVLLVHTFGETIQYTKKVIQYTNLDEGIFNWFKHFKCFSQISFPAYYTLINFMT